MANVAGRHTSWPEIHSNVQYGMALQPLLSAEECGDMTVVEEHEEAVFMAMIDVLGHGTEACAVAIACRQYLDPRTGEDLVDLMQGLHQHIKGSRGAAAGLCRLHTQTGRIDFVGIGNTVARTTGIREDNLPSRSGVIGDIIPKPKVYRAILAPADVLLLYTDGIREHFGCADWPLLQTADAVSIAWGVMARFARGHDDAGCIALRYSP